MITEDYVSFETVKLLKEKGFDEDCRAFYKEWDGEVILYPCTPSHLFEYCCNSMLEKFNDSEETNTAAPTLQMAMKWLREEYKLYIVVRPYVTEEGLFSLFDVKSVKEKEIIINLRTKTGFTTYEEAAEAAIKYCLENLI